LAEVQERRATKIQQSLRGIQSAVGAVELLNFSAMEIHHLVYPVFVPALQQFHRLNPKWKNK
jgi:hypothetical protein